MITLNRIADRLRNALPSDRDVPENRMFKLFLFATIGVMVVVVIAAILAFLFSLEGAEETLVPDVVGVELVDGLLAVQEKELNPRIQLRTTADPSERGMIISQDPAAGSMVRAGRRVSLIVSQGTVVDEVEDYIGWTVDELRTHLRTVFPSQNPLLRVGEIVRVFDEAEAGTIIQQSPESGSGLSSPTRLDIWVSRGPDVEQVRVPSFGGTGYDNAVTRLAELGVPFEFNVVEADPTDERGVVVAQDPLPGVEVPQGTRIRLDLTPPAGLPGGTVFGIFERTLPDYTVPVEINVDLTTPAGEVRNLFSMEYPGGRISFPFVAEPGAVIRLFQFGNEIAREVVPEPETDDES